jgi:hypothetical protein
VCNWISDGQKKGRGTKGMFEVGMAEKIQYAMKENEQ